jgi:hypothetical protein
VRGAREELVREYTRGELVRECVRKTVAGSA